VANGLSNDAAHEHDVNNKRMMARRSSIKKPSGGPGG
jgi:hypothetical protein